MPYATHEEPFIMEEYPMEMDLCSMLQTMKLSGASEGTFKDPAPVTIAEIVNQQQQQQQPENAKSTTEVARDDGMDEDLNYHSDSASDKSNASTNIAPVRSFDYGCAYLRVIHAQMQDYPTTNGEYLDAIFTHREILYSYPAAHHGCARAFSDLAYEIETRAWRADREADMEAVTAFRHEAWMIASTLAPVTQMPQADSSQRLARSAQTCIMMPMA